MSLSAFLAENALAVDNIRYPASPRFVENGKPVQWELRCITSSEDEDIRKSCTRRVQVPGKKNQFTQETDYNAYVAKLAAACTVYPNLSDKGLQDSYHVMGAEALLKAMLTPGEYASYAAKVQEICGFDVSFGELEEEAKN